MSKHKNIRAMADGYHFDSQVERDRYLQLKYLQQEGEIYGLTLQPTFIILPAFTCWGKRIRQVTYTADFKYTEIGQTEGDSAIVVEDVKGGTAKLTEAFGIRWKFVRAQNPSIRFEIVRM